MQRNLRRRGCNARSASRLRAPARDGPTYRASRGSAGGTQLTGRRCGSPHAHASRGRALAGLAAQGCGSEPTLDWPGRRQRAVVSHKIIMAARRLAALERALSGPGAHPSNAASKTAAAPAQPLTIAFIGFRHGHIGAVYQAAVKSPHLEIVGVCEEHAPTRESLAGTYKFTHTDYAKMLTERSPDIVAIGDYFAIRGARAIAALEAGCHVISDKPLCTTLAELDRIEALSAAGGLSVYCQLDMRDSGVFKLAYVSLSLCLPPPPPPPPPPPTHTLLPCVWRGVCGVVCVCVLTLPDSLCRT